MAPPLAEWWIAGISAALTHLMRARQLHRLG
jgi:hypothetical protein